MLNAPSDEDAAAALELTEMPRAGLKNAELLEGAGPEAADPQLGAAPTAGGRETAGGAAAELTVVGAVCQRDAARGFGGVATTPCAGERFAANFVTGGLRFASKAAANFRLSSPTVTGLPPISTVAVSGSEKKFFGNVTCRRVADCAVAVAGFGAAAGEIGGSLKAVASNVAASMTPSTAQRTAGCKD